MAAKASGLNNDSPYKQLANNISEVLNQRKVFDMAHLNMTKIDTNK
jgi:hypothetical protein